MSIDKLPDHVLLIVFKKLRVHDLLRVRLVCRKWATIVSDSIVLRKKGRLVITNTRLHDQHRFVQTFTHSPYNFWAWTSVTFYNVVLEESELVANLCSKMGPNVECLCITFRESRKLPVQTNKHKWVNFLKYTPNLIELEIKSHLMAPLFSGPDEVTSEFNFPNLEKVSVSYGFDTRFNKYITKILTKGANRLSSIDFYGGTKLEFDTLYFLIELQRHSLKELKISGYSVGMENLQKYFSIDNLSLEVLNMRDFELDSQSLKLLGNHKNLRELKCSSKSSENLQEYPSFLMNLDKLEINIYSWDIFPFPKNFSNLKSLKVKTCDDEGEEGALISFETPTYCPNLSVLELDSDQWMKISSVSLQNFMDNFPNLSVLKLDHFRCDSSIVAAIADKLVHLEELQLIIQVKDPAIERNAFSNISNLRKLKQLSVQDYIHICDDRFFLDDLRLPALTDLKMCMHDFNSRVRHITGHGICGLIKNCPILRSISLNNLDGVKAACLYKLRAGLVHLRSVTIIGSLITKAKCNRINNSMRRRK